MKPTEHCKPYEGWTETLDRGGLWHVADDVFLNFFCYMEEEIRTHLSVSQHEGLKKDMIESLKVNEDVQFHPVML